LGIDSELPVAFAGENVAISVRLQNAKDIWMPIKIAVALARCFHKTTAIVHAITLPNRGLQLSTYSPEESLTWSVRMPDLKHHVNYCIVVTDEADGKILSQSDPFIVTTLDRPVCSTDPDNIAVARTATYRNL
jgi:hypothetical protein